MLVGIVGKPNCGKSTFFKALTLSDILIANYPFATIKPNHGIGYVSLECADKFFSVKCNPRYGFCTNNIRFVPVDIIDVAGLVPGAHTGKGMGNQFLDDLRQADVLIHVIDISGRTNDKGEPIVGGYDPANDILFLEEELDYWYLGILKKGWEKFARTISHTGKKPEDEIARQLSGLKVTVDDVKDGISELNLSKEVVSWNDESLLALSRFLRIRTKPMVIAANKIDVKSSIDNYKRIVGQFPHLTIVPVSAESELALKEASKNNLISYMPGDNAFFINNPDNLNSTQTKALEFIQTNIMNTNGGTRVQDTINTAVFSLLGYIAIFPGSVGKLGDSEGNILPDCFLMPPNTTALDFAYKLHTDFGKNFIRATDVKKRISVGKEHLLKHGDVIEIHYKH